jgi:septum formation protein
MTSHSNLPKILLASQSPRRKEILTMAGFHFEVVSIQADEDFPRELKKHEICEYLSLHKSQHYTHNIPQNQLLVTADTIVWVDDEVLNKPANSEEAQEMLRKLSGKVHTVYTGVTIRNANNTHTFHDATEVEFYPLTDEEINLYIQNCRPFDKAGSYGIQDWMGTVGVKGIQGCFYNVMGFPSAKFYRELQSFSKQ